VRIWDRGRYLHDVARLILSNGRAPADTEGDLLAQTEATRVGEREVVRLFDVYGRDTVMTAFDEVQDYVEQLTRSRIAELPDGVWEAEDHIDSDPNQEEGLVPVRVKLEIAGDRLRYDLSGSHPAVGTFLNAGFGSAISGVAAGTKAFFPEIPLNSGFYRAAEIELGPEGSVVNAPWPTAVTGFCSGPYEKIVGAIFEIWSGIMPERAIACSFNLEYLLVGGRDARSEQRPFFMWYDWMVGGWGGRNGRDGSNCTSPVFGVGLAVQPLEGQERLCPVLTSGHSIVTDSGGPGKHRGGCGVEKGGALTQAQDTVVSYCCDRARSIAWGLNGGLPSLPHGVWLNRGREQERFLGAVFSNVQLRAGDTFTRPSAGGGGFGDPLQRDPAAVCEDVIDGYVSPARALTDYGVVVEELDAELAEYRVDVEATAAARERIGRERLEWLTSDPEGVAERYRSGDLDVLDLVRRYGVIVDWGTGELLPRTTETYREMIRRRAAEHWRTPDGDSRR
jgi:N-methylhydantoinase B